MKKISKKIKIIYIKGRALLAARWNAGRFTNHSVKPVDLQNKRKFSVGVEEGQRVSPGRQADTLSFKHCVSWGRGEERETGTGPTHLVIFPLKMKSVYFHSKMQEARTCSLHPDTKLESQQLLDR